MKDYRLILASSTSPDGMALELDSADGEQVAEVFEDDSTKKRTVKFYTDQPVPLEAIEWLLERARKSL
jgi:hypothetical protein